MSEEATAERIEALAKAARVPLDPASPARIANAVAPTVKRLAAENLAYPFETEPLSFVVVARQDLER